MLKGPVLAPWLYPGAAFRPYGDIDLQVPEQHFDAAVHVLEQCGLTEQAFAAEVARQEHAGHVHAGAAFHRVFFANDGMTVVELHADALQLGMQLAAENDRWERAVPAANVPGALMLSAADQLVHLAVHAQKHGFDRLIWLKDLDLLVRQHAGALDWAQAVSIARTEGVTASVWYTLVLLKELLGTPGAG